MAIPVVVKMSAKGQVVIPAKIRKEAGLKLGREVVVGLDLDGRVRITPVADDPIEAACGMFADGPSLTQALLREKKEEREREERKFARFFRPARVSEARKRLRKGK
ncbi:MAG TPA: AbrB/MazE/SpoVT family DNA-binding domain-containing protein [Candidatus Methylomirabilis sp.]|jgi:AbrB family looped-hinge helix DNA binding protein